MIQWRARMESVAFMDEESDTVVLEDQVQSRDSRRTSITYWSWRLLTGVMGVFFFFAALVQLNDPDPILWVPVYGVPCLVSWWVMGRRKARFGLLQEVVILAHFFYSTVLGLWTLSLSIPLLLSTNSEPDPSAAASWKEDGVMFAEESKELLGLCLSTAWMMMVLKQGTRPVRKWQLLPGLALVLLPILSWIHLESIEERIKGC